MSPSKDCLIITHATAAQPLCIWETVFMCVWVCVCACRQHMCMCRWPFKLYLQSITRKWLVWTIFPPKNTNYRVGVKVSIGVGIAGKSWTELVPCGRRETRGVVRGLPGWDWTPAKSDCSSQNHPKVFSISLDILGFQIETLHCFKSVR